MREETGKDRQREEKSMRKVGKEIEEREKNKGMRWERKEGEGIE